MRRYARLIAAIALTHTLAATAHAQSNSWTDGSDKWENGADWSLGSAPSTSDPSDLITNVNSKIVTIDATTVLSNAINGCMTISNLTVSGPLGSTNTLYLNNTGLGTPLDILNSFTISANGMVLVSDSVLRVDSLNGGLFSIDGGIVVRDNGFLIATNNSSYVGYIGTGQMTVSNGTWLAQEVNVGTYVGSQGTLTIAGGTNSLSSFLSVGTFATGAMWLTSGQLTITNSATAVGDGAGGIGQMTVSNGTWLADYVTVGNYPGSQGTLTIAGGTNSLSSSLYVGLSTNTMGIVWVTGGQLIVTNGGTVVGDNGVGQMTVSNGAVLARGVLVGYNSGSQGTLTIAGGQLTATNATTYVGYSGNGQMTVSNGSTWQANEVYVGFNHSSQGTLTIAGGTNSLLSFLSVGRSADAPIATTGTVWVTGGQLTVTNSGGIDVGDGAMGQMTVSNGTVLAGTVNVGNYFDSAGTLTPVGGTLTIAGGTTSVSTLLNVGHTIKTTGTVWVIGGQLVVTNNTTYVGYSGNGQMTVSNGTVLAKDMYLGYTTGSQGTLTLAGGTLSLNGLVLNLPGGHVVFNSGWLNTAATVNSNGKQFVIGDGVDAATFQLQGGQHTFSNGLRIRNNAFLIGCGTIHGNVVVDPGGTVLANCGGALAVTGIVTNNGTLRAINASVLQASGTVVNNGTIDIINGGSTNFSGGFINNGTVLDASSVKISQASPSGQDFVVQVPSVNGHTYQLQYTTSLMPTNWTNTAAPQSGTGGILTFTDLGGATNLPSRFYRVDCTTP
jgi:T5SS/PEP-CTERM-associated repeat protein